MNLVQLVSTTSEREFGDEGKQYQGVCAGVDLGFEFHPIKLHGKH
jgi:hypothetical protein